VFTPAERAALAASTAPDRLAAELWAGKEAGYKLASRLAPATVWSPRRFDVSLAGPGCGRVAHAGRGFALRLDVDGERVHAVAALDAAALAAVRARVAALPAPGVDPSAAVRTLVRREAGGWLGAPPGALRVERRARIPWLLLAGAAAPLPLSLSHHGRFVAFACMLPAGGRRA
jgi:hypothetical protein